MYAQGQRVLQDYAAAASWYSGKRPDAARWRRAEGDVGRRLGTGTRMNDANRAWTKRWQAERPGKVPTMIHAGVYSRVLHYLKAVEALKADGDGRAVAAKMKEMPTDDPLFGRGSVRADGRKIHDAYLFEVKKPAFGDLYNLRTTIPAAEAWRPLKEGGCPLVNV
jgi:branched-chain amino acid transport system substrate-binding protein